MYIFILGLASRLCDGDPAAWHDPNIENCSTVEITRLAEEVYNFVAFFEDGFDNTIMIGPQVLETITGELASITDKSGTAILPNDLDNAINIIEDVLRYSNLVAMYNSIYY